MANSPATLAADSDRELTVEVLREQHLTGRLDNDEFERRLERCLTATSHTELHAITADLPTQGNRRWTPPVAYPGGRTTLRGTRRVVRNLAGVIAILLLAIWGLTGDGYFWPAWAWFGLGVPLALDASLRRAWRRPRGAKRRALVLWTLLGFFQGVCVTVWVLTAMNGSATSFWPVWPLLGFATIAGTYRAFGSASGGRR